MIKTKKIITFKKITFVLYYVTMYDFTLINNRVFRSISLRILEQ